MDHLLWLLCYCVTHITPTPCVSILPPQKGPTVQLAAAVAQSHKHPFEHRPGTDGTGETERLRADLGAERKKCPFIRLKRKENSFGFGKLFVYLREKGKWRQVFRFLFSKLNTHWLPTWWRDSEETQSVWGFQHWFQQEPSVEPSCCQTEPLHIHEPQSCNRCFH